MKFHEIIFILLKRYSLVKKMIHTYVRADRRQTEGNT